MSSSLAASACASRRESRETTASRPADRGDLARCRAVPAAASELVLEVTWPARSASAAVSGAAGGDREGGDAEQDRAPRGGRGGGGCDGRERWPCVARRPACRRRVLPRWCGGRRAALGGCPCGSSYCRGRFADGRRRTVTEGSRRSKSAVERLWTTPRARSGSRLAPAAHVSGRNARRLPSSHDVADPVASDRVESRPRRGRRALRDAGHEVIYTGPAPAPSRSWRPRSGGRRRDRAPGR